MRGEPLTAEQVRAVREQLGDRRPLLIGRLAQLAQEQAALRRVAMLVAHAAPADELFAAVAEEVGRLMATDFVGLARYDSGDAQPHYDAAWARPWGRERIAQ